MDWEFRYALALGITIVVETILACILRPKQARRLAVDVPLMNLVTHPLLHIGLRFGLLEPIGELLVMIVEACVYRRVTGLSLAWSILLAVLLNMLTWILGYVIVFA
jgi:hypothetical protein